MKRALSHVSRSRMARGIHAASVPHITVMMGAMRDRGISLGVAFTFCAVITIVAGILILCVRPKEAVNQTTATRQD